MERGRAALALWRELGMKQLGPENHRLFSGHFLKVFDISFFEDHLPRDV